MALYSNILIDKLYKNIIEIYFYDHKANLYRGLIDLMKDKPFEEIKVSDICNKSMINRII